MNLTNLFVSPVAFKFGISPTGKILRLHEAEAVEGTLLVSGNCRKAVSLRISHVVGQHLEDITALSRELQAQILARVKTAIEKLRLAVVFFYEAAWRCATLRTALKADHRLHTLPHELSARKRRCSNEAMYQLGARAEALLAA